MIKYLAIYSDHTPMNQLTFTFNELTIDIFKSLLDMIRNEIDIELTNKDILNHLKLYGINEMPINFIDALSNIALKNCNTIDMDCIVQVDNLN